ncbi:MAG: hypothetical protein ABL879_08465 [Devosia sp.]
MFDTTVARLVRTIRGAAARLGRQLSGRKGLVRRVTEKYLMSHDFNGTGVMHQDARLVAGSIEDRELDLVRGDGHPNPHIKAFPEEPVDQQLAKLAEQGLGHGCLYPSRAHLSRIDAASRFPGRPYSQALALGAAQLEFRSFDLRLLEFFRNDPRFKYQVDDIFGSIYRKAEHRDETPATVADGLEMARFGFAYDDEMNRAVALYLRDLHGFAPEQQAMMKTYEVTGSYKLHPDFARSTLFGEFPERVSIYDAFLQEKKHINAICALIGKAPLFKTDATHPRPHGFAILLRPTNKEFRDFVMLLNLLLTDDLNNDFFVGDLETTEEVTDASNKIKRQRIGTITLLERWLAPPKFTAGDPEEIKALFKKLRAIRDKRAKPAHVAEDNAFDQTYLRQQRELIADGFDVVRELRMILENHPAAAGYEIPDYLRNARVWSF